MPKQQANSKLPNHQHSTAQHSTTAPPSLDLSSQRTHASPRHAKKPFLDSHHVPPTLPLPTAPPFQPATPHSLPIQLSQTQKPTEPQKQQRSLRHRAPFEKPNPPSHVWLSPAPAGATAQHRHRDSGPQRRPSDACPRASHSLDPRDWEGRLRGRAARRAGGGGRRAAGGICHVRPSRRRSGRCRHFRRARRASTWE